MRFSLLKHNNLMLRSERRERLEAWAASDSSISHRQTSTKMRVSSWCDDVPSCYWASAKIPPAKECQADVALMGQFRIFTATSAMPP